ncbi:MazG nucleotide pyrophosphohydrolase domain-containing protein [Atopococcus tabaci]|uniref:MazG nucleotide pyrophosphohydrolase domain-containing protein n=1 Tax=Atopococcus tabaci TaxID=269774 RepID=UPI00240A759D|nr:MazG nucleotide pyrophosphohydrolase domain-containing protein [Atopococcus tabaci]
MGKVTVIGLGPGHMDQIPVGIYRMILEAGTIYVRTNQHPAVKELEQENIRCLSYDSVYERLEEDFERVYPAIAQDLLQRAQTEEVIYAVPGHPMVAEKSVQLLLENTEGVEVEIAGGKSFLDDLFAAVKVDPVDGFQLVDALDVHPDALNLGQHVIVMQVFNSFVAGEVKLSLMEKYPDEHQVALVDAAGTREQHVTWCPLYEIDRFDGVHNLLSLYVPPLERDAQTRSFETLQYYIDAITGEEGDVWIREQTHESLLPYLREETEEVVEAFMEDDIDHAVEELGDVLMQILYHTNLGEKEGWFSLEDVLEAINKKLRRRHPHVFDGVIARTPEEVDALWQKIKAEEKRQEREDENR